MTNNPFTGVTCDHQKMQVFTLQFISSKITDCEVAMVVGRHHMRNCVKGHSIKKVETHFLSVRHVCIPTVALQKQPDHIAGLNMTGHLPGAFPEPQLASHTLVENQTW